MAGVYDDTEGHQYTTPSSENLWLSAWNKVVKTTTSLQLCISCCQSLRVPARTEDTAKTSVREGRSVSKPRAAQLLGPIVSNARPAWKCHQFQNQESNVTDWITL